MSRLVLSSEHRKDIDEVFGVGPKIGKDLRSMHIETLGDLLDYLPRTYDDYSKIRAVGRLSPGQTSIRCKFKDVSSRYVRHRLHITRGVAYDDSGQVEVVWFNQPYRAKQLLGGGEFYLAGELKLQSGRLSIINPSVESVTDFPLSTARLVPRYKESKNIKSHTIRKLIVSAKEEISAIDETLPQWLLQEYKLLARAKALMALHFPESTKQLQEAQKRYGFEEIFQMRLAANVNRQSIEKSMNKAAIDPNIDLIKTLVNQLPFQLTDDQRRAAWQILNDMTSDRPMNRLLEGDVGSGKTVVACIAAFAVVESGLQTVLMAPTELLAQQHHETLKRLTGGLDLRIELLTGSTKLTTKKRILQSAAKAEPMLIVGTQALIEEYVKLPKLGLVIIDEQHRFGVDQRTRLQKAYGYQPHILHMSATPIPRSLALTLFGELDITLIKTKPELRLPIKTEIYSPQSRPRMNQLIKGQLDLGHQIFVVCPVIESEIKVRANVLKTAELYCEYFKDAKVGVLHGRMSSIQKETTMQAFRNGETDILVSTTVIEVGVDVPNATIMVLESAEFFGLAQAHQLRGRVGRGQDQGFCFLVMTEDVAPTKRLRALLSTDNGFKLAELDMSIRGPGAVYGLAQHGELDLRIANLGDKKLIEAARRAADEFISRGENLIQYPELKLQVNKLRAITNLH